MYNPNYVISVFEEFIKNSQNNVLLGLRLVEKIDQFPDPTGEELKLFQVYLNQQVSKIEETKGIFKNWIIKNGFEDIHYSLRATLERLYVFLSIQKEGVGVHVIEKIEKRYSNEARDFYYPDLINKIHDLLGEELKYEKHLSSFNNARNCLVHTYGTVTKRHCNDSSKTKLVIYGNRFKMFFKSGELEIEAKIGDKGPENAALMLGAEEFKLEYSISSPIELTLEDFINILSTCIFFINDLKIKLGIE